jgi:predicted DNA-binding WGR domain protein
VLHRIDPEQGVRRFYSLMIERDLFGTVRLVRNWGRIGTNGQELVEVFADEIEAGQALEAVARAKRRRGYRGVPTGHDAQNTARPPKLTNHLTLFRRIPQGYSPATSKGVARQFGECRPNPFPDRPLRAVAYLL